MVSVGDKMRTRILVFIMMYLAFIDIHYYAFYHSCLMSMRGYLSLAGLWAGMALTLIAKEIYYGS